MTLLASSGPELGGEVLWWGAGPSSRSEAVRVRRRGPALRAGREPGVFGLDLTAGCGASCPTCHVKRPQDGRVRFDPETTETLAVELEALDRPPRLVVLSPASDPFPRLKAVRAESIRVLRLLVDRGVPLQVMSRGRIPRSAVEILAGHPGQVRVAIGLMTLNREVARALEPGAGSPRGRLRDVDRLVRAGVDVEVRAEPLIPDLTDTRENLAPLLRAVAAAGAARVVVHYLYLQPSLQERTVRALAPFGIGERLMDLYSGGPVFPVGSLGPAKHLPLDRRREGLARLKVWGAEFGLEVATGSAPRTRIFLDASRPARSKSRPLV